MEMSLFLVQLLNGIQYGLLLFLVASGLTLVFGVMGILNLAHGSMYMIGAYLVYYFAAMTDSFWLAVVIACSIAMVIGVIIERFLIVHLYKRSQHPWRHFLSSMQTMRYRNIESWKVRCYNLKRITGSSV